MTLKHTFSFIPVAIEVFEIEDYKDDFVFLAEKINLFSLTRGINRFPGLLMTFEELKKLHNLNDFQITDLRIIF